MKIVIFNNGKYAIRKRGFLFLWRYSFLSAQHNDDYWWSSATEYWQKWALFDTYIEALDRLCAYKRQGKDYGTPV